MTDVAVLLAAIDTVDIDYVDALDPNALAGARAGLFTAVIAGRPPNRFDDAGDNSAILARLVGVLEAAGVSLAEIDDPMLRVLGNGLGIVLPVAIADETMPYFAAAGLPATTIEAMIAYNDAVPARRIPFGQATLLLYPRAAALVAGAGGYRSVVSGLQDAAREAIEADFAAADAGFLISLANYHSPLYATAGYPAVTIPFGLRESGAPVGVTFIGRPGEEAALLAHAYAFEQATRLRVVPELD